MKKPFIPNLPFSFWYVFSASIGIGLFFSLQQYTDHLIRQYDYPFSWNLVLSHNLISYITWGLLYAWVYDTANKFSQKNFASPLFYSLLIILTHRLLDVLIYHSFYLVLKSNWISFFIESNITALVTGFFTSAVQYTAFLGVTLFYLYYKKFLEKQSALHTAELNALKNQLNPHFLFNTLHSISSLVDIDKKAAQKMISDFGYLLRKMLDESDLHKVSLNKELEFIKAYLDIEKTRFPEQMEVIYEVDPLLENTSIPYLILQPVVENVVKHGVTKMKTLGIVRIKIEKRESSNLSELYLSVENDCNAVHKTQPIKKGVGLTNVEHRLEQWYPGNYSFKSGFTEHQSFLSEIRIPFEIHNNGVEK